ncbi:MAG: hypothetical protein FJY97_15510 [candidate division Zixibacteria bacterium]|nr:hypothetical protein [candidate division Zixibacteria bacterium]
MSLSAVVAGALYVSHGLPDRSVIPLLALALVATPFLLVPMLRKLSPARLIETLDLGAKTGEDTERLLRTYLFYRDALPPRPTLFESVRRQLTMRVLSMDLRVCIPLSAKPILIRAALLSVCIALITLLPFGTDSSPERSADTASFASAPDTSVSTGSDSFGDSATASTETGATANTGILSRVPTEEPNPPAAVEDRPDVPDSTQIGPNTSHTLASGEVPKSSNLGGNPPDTRDKHGNDVDDTVKTPNGMTDKLLTAIRSLLGMKDGDGPRAAAPTEQNGTKTQDRPSGTETMVRPAGTQSEPGKGEEGTIADAPGASGPPPGKMQGASPSAATTGENEKANTPPCR